MSNSESPDKIRQYDFRKTPADKFFQQSSKAQEKIKQSFSVARIMKWQGEKRWEYKVQWK